MDGGNVGGAEEADVHCTMRRWLLAGMEGIGTNNRTNKGLIQLNKSTMYRVEDCMGLLLGVQCRVSMKHRIRESEKQRNENEQENNK